MIEDELKAFYHKCGFGETPGKRPKTVGVFTGCMLVPLPNVEARRIYLKYHDLHHLVTGYSVGRIGEGEVSAWELGTGSLRNSPMLAMMNLIALSTGLFLKPERMRAAFERGCRSRNLYPREVRCAVDENAWPDVAALRAAILEIYPVGDIGFWKNAEYYAYCAASLAVHAGLAIPAVIVRLVTDTICEKSIFKAAVPKKRTDLY